MEDIVSVVAIVVLLVLLAASVRKQRANSARERSETKARAGADGAQYERSVRNRAAARRAHTDDKARAVQDSR